MAHEFFTTYTDDSKAVRMTCDTCNEGHTFKSDYFAKQWSNRHAYGITFGKIHGIA